MSNRLIRTLLACACVALVTCSKKESPPASGGSGNQGETITGRERIGWDQQAASAADLASLRYAIYVDGARSEIADVSCATSPGSAGYACNGRLPAMTNGAHTLELASFTPNGSESGRSAPLRVTVAATTAGAGPAVPWTSGEAGVTADGVPLRVERLGEGLVEPIDAAASPDGRVFVAERGGRVLIVDDGRVRPVPALVFEEVQDGGALLSLAIDGAFARTRFVYVLYAAASREGLTYRLARFRELGGILGERAILLNNIASAGPAVSGVVRIAPDGRLLIALGAGREGAPYAGKLLRFGTDGSIPREPATAPVVLGGFESPGGVAAAPGQSLVWIVDRRAEASVLNGLDVDASWIPRVRASSRLKDRDVSSVAVYDGGRFPAFAGHVLVASDAGRHILRLHHDGQTGRIRGEPLLQDVVGGIRVVTVAQDGSIYFCTADAVGRIT